MFYKKLSSVDQYICDALLHMYLVQVPILFCGDIGAVAVMVYALWEGSNNHQHDLLLLWFVLHLVFAVVIVSLNQVHLRNLARNNSQAWMLYQFFGVVFIGVLWGMTPFVFLDVLNLYHVVVITIVLLSVLSATLYTFSLLPPFFYIFSFLVLFPYAVLLSASLQLLPIVLGTGGLAVLLGWISYEISRMLKKILSVQYEKEEYVAQLEEAKADVEQSVFIAEYANQNKNRFLASVSHDLRQPLQAQRLFLASLENRLIESENLDLLKQARHSELELSEMLNELMDIARFDFGKSQAKLVLIELEPLLRALVDEMRPIVAEAGLSLRLHVLPQLYVQTDPVLLGRILRNLLLNAVHYTPEGGVLVGVRRRGANVRIEVWDSGIGISQENLTSIFNDFYQVEHAEDYLQHGLGLGLGTVRRLSFALGCFVDIRSRLGRGSCFSLTLSVLAGIGKIQAVNPSEVPDVMGIFVFVIDDQRNIREGMRVLLRGWGCEVLLAESESALLDELALHRYPVPDVVISDYNMPETTGLRIIASIRDYFDVEVPGFIVSGNMAVDSAAISSETGYIWFEKPLDINRLLRELGKLIKS